MAFGANSRYYGIATRVLTAPDGRAIPYTGRRFAPQGTSLPLLQEATVAQGDRLDWIATRTLGAPEQYWRICDANDAMNPVALEQPGLRLRVPAPFPQHLLAALPLSAA